MDEEIIQRIIYIALGIILFVIFSIKKKPQNQQIPEQEYETDVETEQEYREIFQPVKTLKPQKIDTTIQAETDKLENITVDEIFEDETTIDRRIISKKKSKNIFIEQKEESFQFTNEELRKAIILSEIVHPKHF